MLYFDFTGNFLIGPCRIRVGQIDVGATLDGSDVSLSIEPIIKTFKTDESEEIRKEEKVGQNITFKCELPMTDMLLQSLGFSGDDTSFSNFVEDTFEIIADGITVLFYRASIKLSMKKAYDYSKINSISVDVRALRTDDGLMCNITFDE